MRKNIMTTPNRTGSISQTNKGKGSALLFLMAGGLLGSHTVYGAEIPSKSVVADSFKLAGARQAGIGLKGLLTEIGDQPWKSMGATVLREDGALTVGSAQSALAYVPLSNDVRQAPFKVQIDCQPATTDWIGLSLGGELSDFFKTARITLVLRPSGNYMLLAGNDAELWKAPLLQGKAAKFDATGWNTLELEFDPTKNSVSASINGTDVVRNHSLGEAFPTAQIQYAGVRFNETVGTRSPMQPNVPAVDNFAVTPIGEVKAVVQKTVAQIPANPVVTAAKTATEPMLQPLNLTQFFVQPNQDATLKWKVRDEVKNLAYEVRDYHDQPVLSRTAEVKNGEVQIPVRFTSGFYEIKFQGDEQRFGIVALAPYTGATDKFFAMDTALSWLETRPEIRTDLVALLKRSGIVSVRERLSWQPVNPQPNQWDWETNRQFNTLRQEYKRQGIQVLEMFHGSPAWAKIEASNPYPQRLVETKESWQSIGKQWQSVWDSFEVWNEPDIESGGELPADQYLPIVKTINYAFRESQNPALVGGGVFGYYTPNYIQSSIKNGLLDQVDFVSFHTYAKAPSLEQIIGDYRSALTVKGQAPLPLWLTESGQPWKSGKARPALTEDTTSALDITMKAVESKACGIARYFSFVYPYYVEGERNFGMMGQEVTPLRSMGAYVQAVSALSNTSYVGDLNLNNPAVQRARVFARGDNAVVVLYAEKTDANSSIAWNGPVSRLQGIDGRDLTRLPNGAIPFSDGLAYVHTSLKTLTGISRQTVAAQLTATAQSARQARPAASSIVLQPMLPATAQPTKRGYKVADSALAAFPLRVRINNLSNAPKQVTLNGTVNGEKLLAERKIEVAPLTTAEAQWDVNLVQVLQQSGVESVTLGVEGKTAGETASSSLALEMFCERDLATYQRLYPASTKLDFTDLNRWRSNINATGEMKLNLIDGQTWQLKSSFKGGDRWVYPEFQLAENTDLKASNGLMIRARAMAPSTVRLMVKERSGATYFTPFSFIPADGEWHALVIQWQDLAALPSAPPDPNGLLDLDEITSISLGMNSKADENILEVSDFYVARKTP